MKNYLIQENETQVIEIDARDVDYIKLNRISSNILLSEDLSLVNQKSMWRKVNVKNLPFALRKQKDWTDQGVMRAKWIALPAGDVEPRTVAYRNIFALPTAKNLRVGICADAVYRLYHNGELVAMGPEQGDLEHTLVDVYDCLLDAGEHSIVALVSSFGEQGPYSRMEFCHGFFFATAGDAEEKLDSNATNWQACLVPGHKWKPTWGWAKTIGEELCFHASGYPVGIEIGLCDGFQPVKELYPGRDATLANEYKKQPLFYPATLPTMLTLPIKNYSVRYWGPNNGSYYVATDNLFSELVNVEQALKRGDLRIPAKSRVKLLLELDNYYCLFSTLITSGGSGAKISLGTAEALSLSEGRPDFKGIRNEWHDRYFQGIYDHFFPDGRMSMNFYTTQYRSGRFISLEIETAEEGLRVENFSLIETRYPLKFESTFKSNDNELNELALISRRTLEMCSHDTFMDCPFYEQLMYLGDTRIQALLTLTTSRDDRLVEKALRFFAASQTQSGFLQSRYPSQTKQIIPTFSPFFIGMLEDYTRYRGGALIDELLPVARRIIDAFEECRNLEGVIEINRSWNFVDWTDEWEFGVPPKGEFGVSGVINALYVYALTSLANIYDLINNQAFANYYRTMARDLTSNIIESFYCKRTGLFADTCEKSSFSEHTQVLLLLSGTLPTYIESCCGTALCQSENLSKATTYFTFYLFEVYYKLGRPDLLDKRLDVFREMLNLRLATLLERPEPSRSDCHAWSAHILHHFYASMLGVRPKGYAYNEVIIAPQLLPKYRIEASLPHPGGGEIYIDANVDKFIIILPEGLHGEFISPKGKLEKLHPGRQIIDCL